MLGHIHISHILKMHFFSPFLFRELNFEYKGNIYPPKKWHGLYGGGNLNALVWQYRR